MRCCCLTLLVNLFTKISEMVQHRTSAQSTLQPLQAAVLFCCMLTFTESWMHSPCTVCTCMQILSDGVVKKLSDCRKLDSKKRSPDIFHKLWVLGDSSGNEWNVDTARSWYTGGGDHVRIGNKPSHPWLLKTCSTFS